MNKTEIHNVAIPNVTLQNANKKAASTEAAMSISRDIIGFNLRLDRLNKFYHFKSHCNINKPDTKALLSAYLLQIRIPNL